MTSKPLPINFVLFDLDNTLIDRDEGLVRFCRELYHTSGVMSATHTEDEAVSLMVSWDFDGMRPRQEFLLDIINQWPGVFTDLNQAVQVFVESYPRMQVLEPQTRMLLEDLQDEGIPVAIVTNGGTIMQRRKVEETGLEGLVNAVVISEDAGVNKPNRRIFELALAKIDAHPLSTIFIGDNPDADILGASAVGMRTAWIHRGREWPHDDSHPDYILSHVSEVREIVLE